MKHSEKQLFFGNYCFLLIFVIGSIILGILAYNSVITRFCEVPRILVFATLNRNVYKSLINNKILLAW